MERIHSVGWRQLLEGESVLSSGGRYPLLAYSEFMPSPQWARPPYGDLDRFTFSEEDAYGWHVSELEEEYELKPGLANIARQVMTHLLQLGQGKPAYPIAGHGGANLKDNPYWPPELASHAGQLVHERYVLLLPLALSRTQDDMGRVRWTLFGSSEQGPERAFWNSFYFSPGQERPERESLAFLLQLLTLAYGEKPDGPAALRQIGFRILPTDKDARFPYWTPDALPSWTQPFVIQEQSPLDDIRYLLTFRPFGRLPAAAKQKYLAGQLALLPFPGSLVFWGMPTYRRLQEQLPTAFQIPLLRLVARHGGPECLRVPQSGWLHEPRPGAPPPELQPELLAETYRRTNRWNRVHRYDDELALNPKVDKVTRVLFSTDLDALELYNKPMARNAQLWTKDFELLLDGPQAGREQIDKAEAELVRGGLYGYRFHFPPMRVGRHEIYWHRPLVAFLSSDAAPPTLVPDAPLGYLTAYAVDAPNPEHPVELWPRLAQRPLYLSALREFNHLHDHYVHQTALNLVALLDVWRLLGERPLPRSLARNLLRISKDESLDDWLASLPQRAADPAEGEHVRQELERILEPPAADQALPEALTFSETSLRSFEEHWWQDIRDLAQGRFVNKDNADTVLDPTTQSLLTHHHRDLEALGDYLLGRHRQAIAAAGMEGRAACGDLPCQWRTAVKFACFGGWKNDQEGHEFERDLLVVIPGRNRQEAVVMADHYDTAYMEDIFEKARGGSGARLAAPGADDNHSATATLLQAAPVFLKLAKEGRLERDVWLLHLTGEEFPSDCMGARYFCEALIENKLKLRVSEGDEMALDARVVGVVVMDMIAHNRENARDIFQVSPGRDARSLQLASQAHLANRLWNAKAPEWNAAPDRQGRGRGQRSADGVTIPEPALHPELHGEVRTADDPQSSLYNTDGQIFSDIGIPVILLMENYDINRTGYHDSKDTMQNIDLDYGAALAAIAIETATRAATI